MNSKKLFQLYGKLERDTTTSLPKYLKLCDAILRLVETYELKPGDKLPTEAEFVSVLPISLGTVQKALNTLSDQGVLVRLKGSGTYVAERNAAISDLWHFRFINGNGQDVLPVFTKVLSVDRVKDPGPWSTFLGKDKFFVRITREVDVGHEFKAIAQFFLRGSDFDSLMDFDVKKLEGVHLRNVIHEHFGMPTNRVMERVVAEAFPDAVCHWLKMPYYSMGLVCQFLCHTHLDKPLSFQLLFVPPNVRPLELRKQ